MPRTFKVEGTKSFLYWSLGLLLLGLWAVKDGWFPAESVLTKKSPEELANYLIFNKSLAILCLSVSAICGYIHRLVK